MGRYGPDVGCPCPSCYVCSGHGCEHCHEGVRCSKRGFSKCGQELIERGKLWTPGVKVYRNRGARTVECKIDLAYFKDTQMLNPGDKRTLRAVEGLALPPTLLDQEATIVGKSPTNAEAFVVDVGGQVFNVDANHLLVDDLKRFEKLRNWWNSRVDYIETQFNEEEHRNHTPFHWGQLVWQELSMWSKRAKPVVPSDLDFIVNRRGFSDVQRDFIIEGLMVLGLWFPNGIPVTAEVDKFWTEAFAEE